MASTTCTDGAHSSGGVSGSSGGNFPSGVDGEARMSAGGPDGDKVDGEGVRREMSRASSVVDGPSQDDGASGEAAACACSGGMVEGVGDMVIKSSC